MLRKLMFLVVAGVILLTALPRNEQASAASPCANGLSVPSSSVPSNSSVTVTLCVTDDSSLNSSITFSANGPVSYGAGGTFPGTVPCGASPQTLASGGFQLTYGDACINGIDANATQDPVTTTLTLVCNTGSGGLVSLNWGGQASSFTCGGGSSLLFVTASPNVVPCGGRTLITANIRDVSGAIVPNTVVHFSTDQGLLDPSGSNTAVLTVYPGMFNARVQASVATANGVVTSDVLLQVFCPTPTVQGTPGLTNSTSTGTNGSTPGASTMTLSANPGVVERCGGTVFVVANVKDAGGRPVGGATVLFIASGGTISTDRETTANDGAATITFTADRNMTGSVKINAQAGSAAGSVTIPIACTASEAVQGGSTTITRPSSSNSNSSSNSSTSNESGSGGNSSIAVPPPINSTAPRPGSTDFPVTIRPPSTGGAGLKTAD